MKLMIIESPGKIKKLASILGNEWEIAASVGHVRDLPTKEIGVSAPEFRPAYELTERGKEVVGKLAAKASRADEIYLATDPDREGESISWHLQQSLKLKEYKRVAFNEITPKAVKAALSSPGKIDLKLVAAQEARRVLDRLVGYMVSPALSDQLGETLSAGRVQSPAVRLVVDREREIRAFKPTTHYGAILRFGQEPGRWFANWLTKPDFCNEENPYFQDKAFATAVAAVRDVKVISYKESEARRSPPPPFTTSTMQQAASVVLGMNPKKSMQVAQSLYEQGHITYHRTDNPNISAEAMPHIAAVAQALKLDMVDKQRMFKAPAGAQAGHPAITPTHWDVEEAGETKEEKALYRLIRLRAIACQLADARYAVRTAILAAIHPVQGKHVSFSAVGRTLIYSGWLKLTDKDQTSEDEDAQEPDNPVPALQEGQQLTASSGEMTTMKTKAPPRYTQASLVKKLESEGIGRPATYAAIMDNIVRREYVKTEKKYLVPTERGERIVDALAGKFAFMDVKYTRTVEGELDLISAGKLAYKPTIGAMHEKLVGELSALSAGAPKHHCTECGKPLRRTKGKSGFFWGCTGYPECNATYPDEDGKPGAKTTRKATESTEVDNTQRTYLKVPFDEKNEAKAMGAKWDGEKKAWYVPSGLNEEAEKRWAA